MTEDATDKWVRRVNALANKMHETESAMHPSSWPEALQGEIAEWKRLAKEGPKE